ncbi:DUF29 family protein [Dolichospermum sp. UHCC 0259]|uniref:DUF29 family protein n=1 Tax=Dolichospermum sp. UHCC 0259 TaxID=2590010 RepID=UPI00144803B3|nr:DUF29 family protein [Dolichospermum sp. UHCC 0259]MTJ47136.1 DUF29 domain-containing protein [Dolichospermum sp. UHCC 0259]
MEELLELQQLLINGNIPGALLLVEEMAEMSKDDKLNKIFSFGKIILLHLIQQAAERRTTRSWNLSIANAVKEIQRTNKRRKSGGMYFTTEELRETLEDAYDLSLNGAAKEAFEGRYETEELAAMVDKEMILQQAINLILENAI